MCEHMCNESVTRVLERDRESVWEKKGDNMVYGENTLLN